MYTVLESIATANPPYKLTQSEAADFMLKTESLSPLIRKRVPSIYANSGIDYRYSYILDYGSDPRLFNSKNELESIKSKSTFSLSLRHIIKVD